MRSYSTFAVETVITVVKSLELQWGSWYRASYGDKGLVVMHPKQHTSGLFTHTPGRFHYWLKQASTIYCWCSCTLAEGSIASVIFEWCRKVFRTTFPKRGKHGSPFCVTLATVRTNFPWKIIRSGCSRSLLCCVSSPQFSTQVRRFSLNSIERSPRFRLLSDPKDPEVWISDWLMETDGLEARSEDDLLRLLT